jgi:hypothetical protein
MADEETLLNLVADEAAVRALLEGHDGRLVRDEVDPSINWLDLRPRTAPTERFYVRVGWTSYPHEPPSVQFAAAVGGRLGVLQAWPQIAGYRAPNDICKPFTAEGFSVHPEWRSGPTAWPTEGNPFVWVAETLQYDLDHDYGGRAG